MTDQHKPTNPLLGQARRGIAPAFITIAGRDGDEQVPTEIHAYCAWLNSKEHRQGVWIVVETGGADSKRKAVEWREQTGSDDWLRERGLMPRIGRAA